MGKHNQEMDNARALSKKQGPLQAKEELTLYRPVLLGRDKLSFVFVMYQTNLEMT